MFPLLARGDLCILPAYRGQGTGTAGLRECLAATEKPVFLYVFMSNVHARALYERLGFPMVQEASATRLILQRAGGREAP